MRFFYDTEFIERGPWHPIVPISIGIVAEDGREYYAEWANWREVVYQVPEWIAANVEPHLHDEGKSRQAIQNDIRAFVGRDKPEWWGYYADYDHVVLSQIFGPMVDLPKGWPMYTLDIKQLCVSLGNPKLPKPDIAEHNALADAHWNKTVYDWLMEGEARRAELAEYAQENGMSW